MCRNNVGYIGHLNILGYSSFYNNFIFKNRQNTISFFYCKV